VKVAEATIAASAQESAHNACLVTVVDAQGSRRRLSTDHAGTALARQHPVVLSSRQPIVPFPLKVAHPLRVRGSPPLCV